MRFEVFSIRLKLVDRWCTPSIHSFLRTEAKEKEITAFCNRHGISKEDLDDLLNDQPVVVEGKEISNILSLPRIVSDVEEIDKVIHMAKKEDDLYFVDYDGRSDTVEVMKFELEN
jgi:hypothetical protein